MSVPPSVLSQTYLAEALRRMLNARLCTPILLPAPAAGAELRQVIPGDEVWLVRALEFRFVTSAVVATRTPRLSLQDGQGNELLLLPFNFNQAASDTQTYSGAQGVGQFITNNVIGASLPAPPLTLHGGFVITTSTVNIQAGDQYSLGTLVVDRLTSGILAQYAADIQDELRATFGLGAEIE